MLQNANMLAHVVANVEKVIVGKKEAIELALVAFLAKGHVLIEDMPGVGKTTLVYAIAKSFNCTFKRIQFTPDVMPSDVVGFSMYNQKTGAFEYQQGSIMGQIVLADEINRASPKTQSSLLEVMAEAQVTVDGQTYAMPEPFIVFATQNPNTYVGTHPLPEAQLDRFMMRLSLGYPLESHEVAILAQQQQHQPLDYLQPVATTADLIALQQSVSRIHVEASLQAYIVKIVRATRSHVDVMLGCSPRATLDLYRAAQALALYAGRGFVLPDDVIKVATVVLAHRLVLKPEASFKQVSSQTIIADILSSTPVPA